MQPSAEDIKRVWLGAIAVIGSALLVSACGSDLVGGNPDSPNPDSASPNQLEPLDGSSASADIDQGSAYSAHADAGPTEPRVADPHTPDDPCGRCGNGVTDCGESCDDGNQVTERCVDPRVVEPDTVVRVRVCGANCRWSMCQRPYCGDGIVDHAADEQCDERKPTRTCTKDCKLTTCGQQADLQAFANDYDCDGFDDEGDNCPDVHNPKQVDTNDNGTGDACEPRECDSTSCGSPTSDGCGGCGCGGGSILLKPTYGDWYSVQDSDNDGWEDDFDNCPFDSNVDQIDSDADGVGDACGLETCPTTCL